MVNIQQKLHMETEAAKVLRANLADITDDEEVIADTIEGETNLNELIVVAVKRIGEDAAAVKGIEDYTEVLGRRKDRIKRRIEVMRAAIGAAMEQAGRKQLETALATVSVRDVPASAVIVEEADIPADYWKPQPPKLDKKAVLAALKNKKPVPGATLNNGGKTIAITWI